jgi:hypothetical protein
MSNRPSSWFYQETLYWTIYSYDSSGNLVDADFTPSVDVRLDGAGYGVTAVTVTKRASTTGIYDCSFAGNPISNPFGSWQFEEEVTLSGTAYLNGWSAHMVNNSAEQITNAVLDEPVLNHQISASVGWKIQDTNSRSASTLNIVSSLNDFDPASDTVANVTTVQTCVTNSDMRGTDGANTTAPDNAGIASNGSAITTVDLVVDAIKLVTDKLDTALVLDGSVYQYTTNALENAPSGGGGDATAANQTTIINAISALNDFDPATDTVASVTTVATCTTNTDMRGTDNANTVVPDNTGIAANGTAISNLNDINATDVENAVWDASLSSHNAGGTTGKSLKQIKEGTITIESSINDTAATTISFVTSLTETTTSYYSNKIMVFTSGNLSGQARIITDYNGTTKTITLEEPLTSAPADGSQFLILATHENSIEEIQTGLALATELATVPKTGVAYTHTNQAGDTMTVTIT